MSKAKSVLFLLLVITLIVQSLVTFSAINEIIVNRKNIATLNRIVEKQGALIDWHSHRLTQLERPDEPVFPPRHPGRIGSIQSSPSE